MGSSSGTFSTARRPWRQTAPPAPRRGPTPTSRLSKSTVATTPAQILPSLVSGCQKIRGCVSHATSHRSVEKKLSEGTCRGKNDVGRKVSVKLSSPGKLPTRTNSVKSSRFTKILVPENVERWRAAVSRTGRQIQVEKPSTLPANVNSTVIL